MVEECMIMESEEVITDVVLQFMTHTPTQTTDAVTMAPQDTEVSNNYNPPTMQSLTEIPRCTPTKSILYARHTALYRCKKVTSKKLMELTGNSNSDSASLN